MTVAAALSSQFFSLRKYQSTLARCRGDERQGMTDRFEGVLKLLEGDSNEEKVRAKRDAVTP